MSEVVGWTVVILGFGFLSLLLWSMTQDNPTARQFREDMRWNRRRK